MATANNLGTAYIRIAPQMQGIQSTIQRNLSGLGGKVGTTFANEFTAKWGKAAGVIAGVTSAVATKALGAITNSIDDAIKRVDTLNAFPRIMKNLGFETAESNATLDKLTDRIEGLPTTLDEIVTYTQRLASTTGNLNKGMYNATNLAIAFNDAALAGGKGQYEANRAFEQFVQVVSRGRPSMQDWKIMMEVMPGQLKQVAKYMGTNNKSLQKYAKTAKKTVNELDGLDLYNWISEDKNANAKERLNEMQKALIDLDNKGGAGITAFKDQVGDATHTIGNALRLIQVRITKAMAQVIQAFGAKDVYTTIDKFTTKFKDVGKWIVDYIVPPLRDDVIPAIGNVLKVVKNIVEWIAKTEPAKKTLLALVKAFIGFKVISTVVSKIVAFSTAIVTLGKNLAIAKTAFSAARAAGMTFSSAMGVASAETVGFTAKATGAASKMTALNTATMGFSSAVSGVGIAVAGVATVVAAFTLAMVDNADKQRAAEFRAKEYTKTLISEKNATDAINRSKELEKDLLDDISKAKQLQNDAEYQFLTAKQDAARVQKEFNEMQKKGLKGTDEYRIKELELWAAIRVRDERQKALTKSIKDTKDAQQSYVDNALTTLNEENKQIAMQALKAKNYALVAKQLEDLSTKTYQYRDANGKLVNATKEDMKNAVDYISQQLGRNDKMWDQINQVAKAKGMTFTEVVAQIGKKGGDKFIGNFNTEIELSKPLVTKTVKTNVSKGLADALGDLGSIASGLGKKLGINLNSGIGKGIQSSINYVSGIGSSAINMLYKTMKKTAKAHSPSRLTAELGRDLSLGLGVGMEETQKQLDKTANGVIQSTVDSLESGANAKFLVNGIYDSQYSRQASAPVSDTPAQVIQNNTFNQVANNLDVKEASRLLGWQVATTI